MLRVIPRFGLLLCLFSAGCAATPHPLEGKADQSVLPTKIRDGTAFYEVRVVSIDGLNTSSTGPAEMPVLTVKAGHQLTKVWLASEQTDTSHTPTFLSDASTLKAGIIVQTAWRKGVFYELTDTELRFGHATFSIPSSPRPLTIDLRFHKVEPPVPGQGPPAK